MSDEIEWTNDHAKAWAETMMQPHMVRGLSKLKELLEPKPMPVTLEGLQQMDGYNSLVLAAGNHNRSLGHAEVFRTMKLLGVEKKEQKQLPPPFTAEARA